MKFVRQITTTILLFSLTIFSLLPATAKALDGSSFRPGRIIDDTIFTNNNSMSVAQIQAFLNSKIPTCDTDGSEPYFGTTRAIYSANSANGNTTPFICLNQYYENPNATYAVTHTYINSSGATVNDNYNYHQNNYYQITGFTTIYVNNDPAQGISSVKPIYQNQNGSIPAGAKSAAQLIWDVAQMYNINPQVLIVLLQKEQGIVTDDWAWAMQYEKATGYMCPDTAPCNATKAGFYNQIENAAWQFRFDFDGIGTPGFWAPYGLGQNNIRYSPNTACGTKSVYIENKATAVLYKYTPYTPNDAALANLYGTGDDCSAYGNRNFWRLFNDWFGPTIGYYCAFNVPADIRVGIDFGKVSSNRKDAIFMIYSGTSTNCIEAHYWNPGMGTWQSHIASNHPVVLTRNVEVDYADVNGDGKDEAVLVAYNGTGSGMVEFHVWNQDLKSWQSHIASNLPAIEDIANNKIMFSDFDGDGKDEATLVTYQNTGSGMIEFHVWNQGMQSWRWHIATNYVTVDPSKAIVQIGDLDGDGKDDAMLVGFSITSTNMIEYHIWNPGLWSWKEHIVTNHPIINPDNTKLELADVNGDNKAEGIVIGLKNTGSGYIEFHVWNQGMTSWMYHAASNQITL